MVEISAKDRIRDRMSYDKEKQLLQEQMSALRSALKISQAENDAIRKDLEKEVLTDGSLFWDGNEGFLKVVDCSFIWIVILFIQ